MINKSTSLIKTFFGFLCLIVFYLPVNKIFATDLEVQYPPLPTVAGQSTGAVTDLPSYVKYLFEGGMSIGFSIVILSLTVAGVMYFLAPLSAEMRANAKDRATGAISGLLILVLTYLIITTINPQLNAFNINKLTPATIPSVATTQLPGVYFYNTPSCSDNTATPYTSNLTDLGDNLRRKVVSVKVVQDSDNGNAYLALMYENPNLWGKCQYISTDQNNSAQTCKTVDAFASSASIYQYDFNPGGDGVYFFRKSCFNDGPYNDINELIEHCSNKNGTVKDTSDPNNPNQAKALGGYYEVEGSSIKGIYVGKLDDLSFKGVPETEQDCTKYDENNKCTNRKPPTLGGQNISSIIINGNYLVLLVYVGPNDSPNGPWTACQEFPTANDVNKLGPRQIKWEVIRNSGNNGISTNGEKVVPNYVIIIPIKAQTTPPPTTAPVPISAQ